MFKSIDIFFSGQIAHHLPDYHQNVQDEGDSDEEGRAVMVAHLNLVDLAGSERANQVSIFSPWSRTADKASLC